MLDDAVYYSRREADEKLAAGNSADPKVRQIHMLLADRYSRLALRALAAMPDPEPASADISATRVAPPRKMPRQYR